MVDKDVVKASFGGRLVAILAERGRLRAIIYFHAFALRPPQLVAGDGGHHLNPDAVPSRVYRFLFLVGRESLNYDIYVTRGAINKGRSGNPGHYRGERGRGRLCPPGLLVPERLVKISECDSLVDLTRGLGCQI